MKKFIFAITVAAFVLSAAFGAFAQVTNIKTDWENGAQYYYYISGSTVYKVIAFQDSTVGIYEYWDGLGGDGWVPMRLDRQDVWEVEFDPAQSNVLITDAQVSTGFDSALVPLWEANTGIDTTFQAIFSWDDTTGGAFIMKRIGTANDSSKLIKAGAPFHVDTSGTHSIKGILDVEFPDSSNGWITAGLVEPTSFGATSTTDGIFLHKANNSNKVMAWKVRDGSIDSVTVISNVAVNTRYRIGIYDDGQGNTHFYVDGTYTATVSSYSPWDEDLTLGVLWKTGTAGALKTGRIFYGRFRQFVN